MLLLDDDASVLQVLRMALRAGDFEVLTATSPAQALRILGERDVSVVLSDDRMPEMRGMEFLSIVKDLRPQAIRMMLTGELDVRCAAAAINVAGVFRFLLKPCSSADLQRAVADALGEWRARAEQQALAVAPPVRDAERDAPNFDAGLDKLWLAFQPIVRAANGETVAYEALARSREARLETPDKLLQVAAELGRLLDFERRVREVAVDNMAKLPPGCEMWVNIHPVSLQDDELASDSGVLTPFAPRIVLEITERSALQDTESLRRRIEQLRALGFRIAIDDLGSGYSGLNSFASLSPEFVKYDRELIQGLATSSTRRMLVESINSVCSRSAVRTVAEGVEHQADLDQAVGAGCEMLQGYLIGRPAPEFCT